LPKLVRRGDVFAYGHTHLYQLEQTPEGITLFNPGSVTLPKQGRPATFGFITPTSISVRRLDDGEVLLEM
jgi:predicted phosphodiesterase